MNDIEPWFADVLSRVNDLRESVAAVVLDAQGALFAGLRQALVESGRSKSEVADLLALDVERVDELLSGAEDLSLTELRHIAIAVDAVVQYRVTPRASAHLESHRAFVHTLNRSEWNSHVGILRHVDADGEAWAEPQAAVLNRFVSRAR